VSLQDELIADSRRYLMDTYARYPVALVKGQGMRVVDAEGREYLDFMAGVAVNNLGHCHPRVVVALQKQAQRLLHVSNFFHIEPQIRLAKLLVEHSFADRVFFCNSGAEANEAAIKLARKYGRTHRGPRCHEIITAEGAFHGRTLATLTATGNPRVKEGFEPLLPGFRAVPYNDLPALASAISEATCAVMLEPIQGEAGVIVPDPGYLAGVRELCDRHGLLLILDEVQTGMGRTGRLFAYEHAGIVPDIVTLAKGLGGGVPIGACLATERVAAVFGPGSHASTFGGNPLACAAGVAALEALLEDGILLENCRRVGAYFMRGLQALKQKHPVVQGVRGMGLLLALVLATDAKPVVEACLERGFLVNATAERVLRFMPPLVVLEQEVDRLLEVLDRALAELPAPEQAAP